MSSPSPTNEFKTVEGKDGKVWLIQTGPFPAEDVRVSSPVQADRGQRQNVILETGVRASFRNVMISNAQAMLEETGVDITDGYASRVTVSRHVVQPPKKRQHWVFVGKVYEETEFQRGTKERPHKLVKEFQQKAAEAGPLFYKIEYPDGYVIRGRTEPA